MTAQEANLHTRLAIDRDERYAFTDIMKAIKDAIDRHQFYCIVPRIEEPMMSLIRKNGYIATHFTKPETQEDFTKLFWGEARENTTTIRPC